MSLQVILAMIVSICWSEIKMECFTSIKGYVSLVRLVHIQILPSARYVVVPCQDAICAIIHPIVVHAQMDIF